MKTAKILSTIGIALMLSLLLLASCSSDSDPSDIANNGVPGIYYPDPHDEVPGISYPDYSAPADTTQDDTQQEIQEAPEAAAFPFPFSAYDVHGNHVTAASLGDKDLFFIYFWSTWCPSCIAAMPDLVQMSEEFGDRVGFMSLQGDFFTARDTAVNILNNAGITFPNLPSMHPEFEELVEMLRSGFVPTSVIIDRDGNMVGDQIVGRGVDRFQEAIEYALGR